MIRFALILAATLATALALMAPMAEAQITLPPGYDVATVTPGSSLGISGNLGGIEFNAGGSLLYIGGGANASTRVVLTVPVLRDPITNYVTGFGASSSFATAPYIDGGLETGPSSTMFFTQYPTLSLGEIVGTTTYSFALPSTMAAGGGLTFVPAGLPNAGAFLIGCYGVGNMFTVTLVDNGDGTYTPSEATLFAALPFRTEGMRYVPSGPYAGDIIFTNDSYGNISILDIDPLSGLPAGGASSPVISTFATGIAGAEGFAFDPLTNDIFVMTYSGSPWNSIIRISGFPAPSSRSPEALPRSRSRAESSRTRSRPEAPPPSAST